MDKKIQEMLSNKEFFEKIYDEFIEEREHASDRVVKSYKELNNAFEEYICAVEEDTFRLAFMFGYEMAQREGLLTRQSP